MKKIIYKYDLQIKDYQILELPLNSKILKIDEQHGDLKLWAEIDKDIPVVEQRHFKIVGTGHEFENHGELDHIATVLSQGGNYVWHIYEVV